MFTTVLIDEAGQDAAVAASRCRRHRRRALRLAVLHRWGLVSGARVWRAADRMVRDRELAERAHEALVRTLADIELG